MDKMTVSMDDVIIAAAKSVIDKIAQEELENARKRMQERLPEMIASIGILLHRNYEVQFMQDKISVVFTISDREKAMGNQP